MRMNCVGEDGLSKVSQSFRQQHQEPSKDLRLPGVVVYACNPSTQEVEAGDQVFQASLDYITRPCLKNQTDRQTDKHELDVWLSWKKACPAFSSFVQNGCGGTCL